MQNILLTLKFVVVLVKIWYKSSLTSKELMNVHRGLGMQHELNCLWSEAN